MTGLFTKMQTELGDTHKGQGSIPELVAADSCYHSEPGIEDEERKHVPESGERLQL